MPTEEFGLPGRLDDPLEDRGVAGGEWSDIFAGLAEMNPSLLQTANLLEARIDLKLAGRRRLVPVVLNPVRDKVSGIHLDHAIEPWLAERGFSHADHETLFLESA